MTPAFEMVGVFCFLFLVSSHVLYLGGNPRVGSEMPCKNRAETPHNGSPLSIF